MAEEEIGVTSGAKTARENVLQAQAGGEELRAIGFGEIEVDIARRGLVARGRHAEPLQRIGLIAGARLVEILGGVRELRSELGDKIRAHFVTAGTDGGPERGEQVARLAAEFETHAANGFLGDAGERALPTRMDGGDGVFLGINEKDRDAIGGLHGEEQTGTVRDGGVALARKRGRGGEQADRVGVDLLQRLERKLFRAECGLQEAAVFGDVFARVPFHEAEIELRLAIEWADATGPRAETVDQPGEFAKWSELQHLQTAGTV